jgi:aldose 1-epimerase
MSVLNSISHKNPPLIEKSFGNHPNGKEVLCYKLTSNNGMELEVINYGATLVSLKVPLKNSSKVDVVLGFDKLSDYINSYELPSAPYIGALVGRYAGRINQAQFELNNQTILLTKNHIQHQLHGGFEGFSKAFWDVISASSDSITLAYRSPNGEENYPGEVLTQVTYSLTDTMELHVEITANSDQDTPLNLTQHSYFNLDGHSETIENQELLVNSKEVLETTNENIPTGNFISLLGHEFDFSKQKKCPTSIDSTFVLNKNDEAAALLFSKKNNLKMSVFTNQPGVHIYVGGNCFNQIKGKENRDYHTLSGICFETQNFPDAPNHAHFPNAIVKKGATYGHKTTFKFENI